MSCVMQVTPNQASKDISIDCIEHGFIGYIGNYDSQPKENAEIAKRMFEDHLKENGNPT